MNVDYSVYKLDQDKVIVNGKVRRKQDNMPANEGVLRIANIIVGDLLKKWKTFASSNLHGDKPLLVRLDESGKPQIELKKVE